MATDNWSIPSPRLTWSVTKAVVLQSVKVQKLGRIQNYTGLDRYNSCARNSPWTCNPGHGSCTSRAPLRWQTGTCRTSTIGPQNQSMCLFRCETSEIGLSEKQNSEIIKEAGYLTNKWNYQIHLKIWHMVLLTINFYFVTCKKSIILNFHCKV